ncbi:MAG: hypothetical protein M1814_002510 [Vezdaea aestivalis]|nr:MAG: hypothetical protein M1814_002510 [Vezdaea aestivalis]
MVKTSTFCINWHQDNSPIYSAHFEPHGKGRLATAGGDNNVRLWKVDSVGDDRNISYLTTLKKHSQAVNVVRFAPKGEMLASAGDDGNVLLWVPSDTHTQTPAFGEEGFEEKETWRIKHMCRSVGTEIYDLAWSPDAIFFITGSMDNVARIYNAQTGQSVRQIAEHNHYVQGVAWDPLNEFVATQSSDRSVHIYSLKTKDGQFTLAPHNKSSRMDIPSRRISSNSPAPPDMGARTSFMNEMSSIAIGSPGPSAPGTPTSLSLPMNPPAIAHSRRSSFGSSPSIRRSVSPAPSLPLPAVKPMESSPRPHHGLGTSKSILYANETLSTFFRRLCFTPEGSLLFTPAGQYRKSHPLNSEGHKPSEEVINTVYIYTRAGLNKPPVAHLPGTKKPSIAVRCSPICYLHRKAQQPTKSFTVDTSSAEEPMPSLPEPAVTTTPSVTSSVMDPPPPVIASPGPTSDPSIPLPSPKFENDGLATTGPQPAFLLPYRMIYAVATHDAVLVYDTQQQSPLCIVSNLHFATFTDLTWSSDGLTLLMSSSDGFCSSLTFSPGELGQIYTGTTPSMYQTTVLTALNSAQSTPAPTPTSATAPPLHGRNLSSGVPPSPSHPVPAVRPSSPTRSNSTSSVATQSSHAQTPGHIISNPTPTLGNVPSLGAASSGLVTGIPITTPPQTPASAASSVSGASVLGKRDASSITAPAAKESDPANPASKERKKRRVAPTLVLGSK